MNCRVCGRALRREEQAGYPPANVPAHWMLTCDNEDEGCPMAGYTLPECEYASVDLCPYIEGAVG